MAGSSVRPVADKDWYICGRSLYTNNIPVAHSIQTDLSYCIYAPKVTLRHPQILNSIHRRDFSICSISLNALLKNICH